MRVLTLMSLLLLFCSGTSGQKLADERESLRGLKGVSVSYNVNDKAGLEKYGLSLDLIRNDITLRLRKAGIPVYESPNDLAKLKGHPRLETKIHIFNLDDEGSITYVVSSTLWQEVYLARVNDRRTLYLRTWAFNGAIGLTPKADLQGDVRKVLADITDEFINDYLAANNPYLETR